jgi:hypothetical protein
MTVNKVTQNSSPRQIPLTATDILGSDDTFARLTPLIAYAVTHAHSRQWLRAITILLEREGRDG